MRTLYLECNMGAAGDMLTAALLELHPSPDRILCKLNDLDLPNVRVTASSCTRSGICGTQVTVTVDGTVEDGAHHHKHAQEHDHSHCHAHDVTHCHEAHHEHHHTHHADETGTHHHTGMHEIQHLIEKMNLPERVKGDALSVYRLIAQAEAQAHGRNVDEIHFHEVGNLDAIADIVAVCLLMNELAPDQIIASPIHVGCGTVHCAHGIMPVPAPATAALLQDVPTYGGAIQGELCTPTGAALLKYYVNKYQSQPLMRVQKTGYGMGRREFETVNCVRAMLGDTEDSGRDSVYLLECNLDDMTAEDIGFAADSLRESGALEVYTTAVQMKKNRPGVVLSVLCAEANRDQLVSLLFRHTTTLGIRETLCKRYTLSRSEKVVSTEYGDVRVKTATGWGVTRSKADRDDLCRIASEHSLPVSVVRAKVEKKQ